MESYPISWWFDSIVYIYAREDNSHLKIEATINCSLHYSFRKYRNLTIQSNIAQKYILEISVTRIFGAWWGSTVGLQSTSWASVRTEVQILGTQLMPHAIVQLCELQEPSVKWEIRRAVEPWEPASLTHTAVGKETSSDKMEDALWHSQFVRPMTHGCPLPKPSPA